MDFAERYGRRSVNHWVGGSNGTLLASQIHLNLILAFTAIDNSEYAFSLRNQGKGVFYFFFYPYYLSIVYATSHKDKPGWFRLGVGLRQR